MNPIIYKTLTQKHKKYNLEANTHNWENLIILYYDNDIVTWNVKQCES